MRCSLRADLTPLLITPTGDVTAMQTLIDVLCAVDRPESIIVWKRSPKVQSLLTGLGDGTIALTHEGLDACGDGGTVSHLRALLQHHGLLPHRDPHLARFEAWIGRKLVDLPEPVARPVEQFATWHHLRRIRAKVGAGAPAR